MEFTNFDKLLEVGRVGENAVSKLLTRNGCEVEDVSTNKWYQVNDIDFVVRQTEKYTIPNITLEVKTDRRIHETMNICLEIESNCNPQRKKEGWFKTSKADWFAFYSPAVEATYFVKRKELIAYYEHNKLALRHVFRDQVECGKYIKTGVICLIPISDIQQSCPSTQLVDNAAAKNFDFLFSEA